MTSLLIDGLQQALAISPDNLSLRLTLVRALYQERQANAAAELLMGIAPADMPTGAEADFLARVLLDAGQPARALQLLPGDSPEQLRLRAEALLEAGDQSAARVTYARAIAANPTLEDVSLAARLEANGVPIEEGRARLRLVVGGRADEAAELKTIAPQKEIITFADIGGLDAIKEQIRKKIITPFHKPALFSRFRKKVGGGILLYGPPGCGKTLLARATAGECNANFFNIQISDVLDMYIGESERKLHDIFEAARQAAPAVLFFDEIEALAGKRQNQREASSSKLVSQFLSELDGFADQNKGVLVLGATNVPWALDPAFRRPGRFDRVVFVSPPDRPAREDILRGLLRHRPGAESIVVAPIAEKTGGFSGADLMHLVESAVDEAIDESIASEQEVPLSQAHIHAALKEIKPTTLEWLTMARNYAKYANDAGQYDEVLDFIRKHGK